jgi:peptidyl-prolyl cis-trans isomerase C
MKYLRTLLFSAGFVALAACQPQAGGGSTPAAASNSPPVATVNGTPIRRDFFEFYVKQIAGRNATELNDEQRGQVLDNLVRAELVAQQANKDGIDKTQDTAALLELTRINVLEQAVSQSYLKDKKASDQELRAEYEAQVAKLPKTEYHARHILVATQPYADRIVESLKKGIKFDELARRESMDPSKENGGDLGWFTPERMDKAFADAVVSLKPGEYTDKPVQTQYGWHVIQLLETRDTAPPPFDNVKQRLEQVVEAKKFKAYTDELMRNAKIDKPDEKKSDAAKPEAAKPEAAKAEDKKG